MECCFTPVIPLPTEKECYDALGDISKLPDWLCICFEFEGFTFKKITSSVDWVCQHESNHQTFLEFLADGPNPLYKDQNVIYLKPFSSSINK